MSCSKTLLFGKFARTQMRSIYQKLYRRVYNARLSANELTTFQMRAAIIGDFEPLVCSPCSSRCDWVVYTDASTSPPRICALQFHGPARHHQLEIQLSSAVPVTRAAFLKTTCLIFGSVLLSLVTFLEERAPPWSDVPFGSTWAATIHSMPWPEGIQTQLR